MEYRTPEHTENVQAGVNATSWWAWLAAGVVLESIAVRHQAGDGTLSQVLKPVFHTRSRRLVWLAFCFWSAWHITCDTEAPPSITRVLPELLEYQEWPR